MNENTQLQLARLLYDYSSNNNMVNKAYIDKLMDIVVNGKNLNDYVSNYEISGENSSLDAGYIYSSRKITIYAKKIYGIILNEMRYATLLPDDEKYLFINSIITQIILHEIEHANQRRIIEKENNLESDILKLCEFKELTKIDELESKGLINDLEAKYYKTIEMSEYMNTYHELYEYAPDERLAQIKSYQELIDSLRFFKDNSKILELEELYKLGNILNAYRDTSSPTITYLNTQGRNEELKQFDWYSDSEEEAIKLSQNKFVLRDRIKYGLPIDKKEKQFVKEIYIDMSC